MFQDAQGRNHTVTSSTGSSRPAYEVGQQVRVLYDPADPQQARLHGFAELWLFPVTFSSIGILCLVLSAWWLRRRVK